MKTRVHGAKVLRPAGIAVTLAIGLLTAGQTAFAAGPAPVGLGTAAPFAVLAGTPAVTNTGATFITGDVGISPAAAVAGFPPGIVSGTIHAADAVALQAQNDLASAYVDAAGRPATATHGTLGGLTLVSGVYTAGGVTLDLTGTLTLDGQNDPNAVWVFQATSDLITASSSNVRFINGAQPCNVYWQVTSSATLGSGSTFAGTILALTSITMNSGVTMNGRALARNGDVTLIDDTITRSTCAAATPTLSPTPSATTASPTATVSPTASLSATPSLTASPRATPTASPTATVSPTASLSATPSLTASPRATPTASPTAIASPTPTSKLTPRPTARPTLPPTATLATTDVSGSGPTPVVFFAVLLLALVVVGSRRSLRATHTSSDR